MPTPLPSDALVFFGATGDLAHKMIFPALHALVESGRLDMPVVGVANAGWNIDRLRDRAKDSLEKYGSLAGGAAFAKLSSLMRYVDGDYRDPGTFDRLRRALGTAQRPLHYLAIPPSLFGTVVNELARSGLARDARIVVEKPFGHDLASARELNRIVGQVFDEAHVFRIDHFLGKEPVQNLLYFRFANCFLEPIWNHAHVASVEITLAESFGVQGRGRFYEETGTIRDVLQNHMMQVLACTAMDPPAHGAALGDAKVALLDAIAPLSADTVVRGQFRGYRDEPGVAPDSTVETYAAVRLAIDNARWAGVPFFLRSGKCLALTATEVFVALKPCVRSVFGEELAGGEPANHLRFRLEPDVTIAFGVRSKIPGETMEGRTVELVATRDLHEGMLPYERLLGDALAGDNTLFARQEGVEAEWRIVDGVLGDVVPVHPYEPGSWGPPEARRLVASSGGWHDPRPARTP